MGAPLPGTAVAEGRRSARALWQRVAMAPRSLTLLRAKSSAWLSTRVRSRTNSVRGLRSVGCARGKNNGRRTWEEHQIGLARLAPESFCVAHDWESRLLWLSAVNELGLIFTVIGTDWKCNSSCAHQQGLNVSYLSIGIKAHFCASLWNCRTEGCLFIQAACGKSFARCL